MRKRYDLKQIYRGFALFGNIDEPYVKIVKPCGEELATNAVSFREARNEVDAFIAGELTEY